MHQLFRAYGGSTEGQGTEACSMLFLKSAAKVQLFFDTAKFFGYFL
jgi:hypothetical protein